MIRVVLDANVLVSALLGSERSIAPPSVIMRLWLDKAFVVVISSPLYAEVERTVGQPFVVDHVAESRRAQLLQVLSKRADHATIAVTVEGVASHPEDDLILATALSAQVDYLVTGDKQLLARDGYEGLRIVSPRAFLDLLERTA